MELVFTKGAGKHDRLTILRAGTAPETIDCPKQRIIPHDMVHYAVETVLAAHGFLGRVAAGESADFVMAAEPESDAVERLVEVFQGDSWSGGTEPPDQLIDLYRVTCDARDCPMQPIDAATINAVRARIAELGQAWDTVPIGGELRLTFACEEPFAVSAERQA
jgi:hypothetical protein